MLTHGSRQAYAWLIFDVRQISMRYLVASLLLLIIASGCSSPSTPPAAASSTPPTALYQPLPEYPLELRKAGVTGRAVVEFVVSEAGEVVEAHAVTATHPLFAAAAVDAILRSKFTAPLKNGSPINARMQIPVDFNLAEDKQPNQALQPTPTAGTSAAKQP